MEKRKKDKYNPYKLIKGQNEKIFIISFKSIHNEINNIPVSREIYEVFNKSELKDLSLMHEYERHIEHFDLDENSLYKKSVNKFLEVEEQVELNLLKEELRKLINELPLIQKRRLIKYFFDNKTYQEIALEEHCSRTAIKYSIDLAIEKISKKMKN